MLLSRHTSKTKHPALRRGASGASEEVLQLNIELRQTALSSYNTIYRMLEIALEMTNSQACLNRELIYLHAVGSSCVLISGRFSCFEMTHAAEFKVIPTLCSNMRQVKLHTCFIYSTGEAVRGTERALRLSGKCRLFV